MTRDQKILTASVVLLLLFTAVFSFIVGRSTAPKYNTQATHELGTILPEMRYVTGSLETECFEFGQLWQVRAGDKLREIVRTRVNLQQAPRPSNWASLDDAMRAIASGNHIANPYLLAPPKKGLFLIILPGFCITSSA